MQIDVSPATFAKSSLAAESIRRIFGVVCALAALALMIATLVAQYARAPQMQLLDFFPTEQNTQIDYQFARPRAIIFLDAAPPAGSFMSVRLWSPDPLPPRELTISQLGRDGERTLLRVAVDATPRTLHMLLPPADQAARGYALALTTPAATAAGDERALGLLYESIRIDLPDQAPPWLLLVGAPLLLAALGGAVLLAGLGGAAAGFLMLALAAIAALSPLRFALYGGAVVIALSLLRVLAPGRMQAIRSAIEARVVHPAAWLSLLIALGYGAYFGFLAIANHQLHRTNAYDLGLYDQTLWLISHFQPNYSTGAGINMVGSHANLMLFPLALIYALVPDPRWLVLVQALAVGAAALPLYWIARDRGAPWLGPVLALVYLLHPATQNMTLFDFHVDSIAATLLIAALWAADRRRWLLMGALCAAILLSKETFALTIAWLGVLLIFWRREWRAGGVLVLVSIGWFFAATRWLAPLLVGRDESLHVGRFSQYGDSLASIVWTMLSNPQLVLLDMFQPETPGYMLMLLLPMAFVPLLSPVVLLLLPALAINLLSSAAFQRSIDYHYAALSVAILAVAGLHSLLWLAGMLKQPLQRRGLLLGGAALMAVATLSSQELYGVVSRRAMIEAALANPEQAQLAARRDFALSLIPPAAPVAAQSYLQPHLTQRRQAYLFPNPFLTNEFYNPDATPFPLRAEYVIYDTRRVETTLVPGEVKLQVMNSLEQSGLYERVVDLGGLRVLRRAPLDLPEECFGAAWSAPECAVER